jgi:beta-lactamase regulating signal transducer with metallopeptidase domain/WD40 repeat protein
MYSLVEIGILNAITATVLASIVWLISRVARRPAFIHALWVLVLLKLVTPPIVEIPIGLRVERLASLVEANDETTQATPSHKLSRRESARTQVVVQATPTKEAFERDFTAAGPIVSKEASQNLAKASGRPMHRWLASTMQVLLWAWATGAIIWYVVQGLRIVLFARLSSTARLATEEIQQQARQLATKIGLRRVPRIWVLDATMSPVLWALGSRARVIFPADLLDRVDNDARATLLTHELAHYHRGDHWVRLIEFVVTGLFWWHPVVWLARREIEVAEEHCCDAWVIAQFPDQPRRYAEALLDTIDFLSEEQPRVVPVASGLGQVPFLRERIRLIMLGVAPKSMSGKTRLAVVTAAAFLLPLGPQLFEGAIRQADAALGFSPPSPALDSGPVSFHSDPAGNAEVNIARPDGSRLDEPIAHETDIDQLIQPLAPDVSPWAIVNSPDGRFQAIARANGKLSLRDTFQQRSFDLSEYQVSSIAFAPHRDLLAAGSSDSTVYLFDCASGEPIITLTGHQAGIGSVAVSLDGRFVVSGSRDGKVKLWDIDDESEVPSRVPAQPSAITCVGFSPDGRLLAIACGDWMTSDEGSVVLWDLRGGSVKQQLTSSSPVGAIAFAADGLLVAEWGGRTMRWDFRSDTLVESASVSKDTVSAAAFAADAQSLLLAAASGEVRPATTPAWFQRMDRDRDGQLAWSEFGGPRSAFRKLDLDSNRLVTQDEVGAIQ